MSDDLPFSCDCGKLTGHLAGKAVKSGTHVLCFCRDCRSAELFALQPDPGASGVDLFQVSPDLVTFDKGLEHLTAFSLKPDGILRWQARCCGAIMFNTLRNPRIAFASLRADRLADKSVLGPVVARAFVTKDGGKQGHEGLARLALRSGTRIGWALLTGKWRQTPFFDAETLKPVREPYVLAKAERAALLSDA